MHREAQVLITVAILTSYTLNTLKETQCFKNLWK